MQSTAVKSLWVSPLSKQDFLLFDHVVLDGLDKRIETPSTPPESRAELEWLRDSGLISNPSVDLRRYATLAAYMAGDGLPREMMLAVLINNIARTAALGPSPEASLPLRGDFAADVGLNNVVQLQVRLLAREIAKDAVGPVVPIIRDLPLGGGLRPHAARLLDEMTRIVPVYCRTVLASDLPPEIRDAQLFIAELVVNDLTALCSQDAEDGGKPAEEVVAEVVLRALPVPDESVPWERIVEFRRDEELASYALQLRKWIRGAAERDLTATGAAEELAELLSNYKDHMRFLKMKTHVAQLQSIITLPLSVAESLVRFRLSDAVKALFELRFRKIALMESERSAPGREVAYILKAQDVF
ncbi:MAG TPA: hypothetical protein VJT67_10360 [Longimicrobiaceae bacterium]|nr:hypothetical protein [Longimicrobiaceae bacterium]